MKSNFEHTVELNNDIKDIAKRNGMKKEEWIVWALTEMVKKIKEIQDRIDKRTTEEVHEILRIRGSQIRPGVEMNVNDLRKYPITQEDMDRDFVKLVDGPAVKELMRDKQSELMVTGSTKYTEEELKEAIQKDHGHIGADLPTNKEITITVDPLEENGMPSLPTYTFYLTQGGESKIKAESIDAAIDKLGIGEEDYMDYKVTE